MRTTPITTMLKFTAAALGLCIYPILVVWLSGNWRSVEVWIFGLSFPALYGACLLWLYRKDPALLAERFRTPGSGGESRTDLVIFMLMKVMGIAWFILPPLDLRYDWLPRMPIWVEGLGAILFLFGSFFFFRAFTDNTFVSPLVRIQSERKQHVIETGVYGIVRHPMYLGATMFFIGGALIINSVVGLFSAFGLSLLLFVRVFGEEKLLASELEGYEAYRQKVCYRMIPYIW